MKLKLLKNRSALGAVLIIVVALIGLIFVKTDNVAADRTDLLTTQSIDNVYAPASGDSGSMSVLPSLIRIISALVIVVVCIYGGIYLLKRLMNKRDRRSAVSGNLEVIETIYIAPRKSITLLRVGEKSVLVGATENNMSLLGEQDEAQTSKLLNYTEPETETTSFGEMMDSAIAKVKEVARKSKKPAVQAN